MSYESERIVLYCMGRLRPSGLVCARIGAGFQENENHQLRDIHSTITKEDIGPDCLGGTASTQKFV